MNVEHCCNGQRNTKVPWEKPIPVPFCPPQILAWDWTAGLCGKRQWQTLWVCCLCGPQLITDFNKLSWHYSKESLSETSRTTISGGVHSSSSRAGSTMTTWWWSICCRGNIVPINIGTGWSLNSTQSQWVEPALLEILHHTNGLY